MNLPVCRMLTIDFNTVFIAVSELGLKFTDRHGLSETVAAEGVDGKTLNGNRVGIDGKRTKFTFSFGKIRTPYWLPRDGFVSILEKVRSALPGLIAETKLVLDPLVLWQPSAESSKSTHKHTHTHTQTHNLRPGGTRAHQSRSARGLGSDVHPPRGPRGRLGCGGYLERPRRPGGDHEAVSAGWG